MKERRFNLAFLSVKSNILFLQDGFLFPRDRDAVDKRAKKDKETKEAETAENQGNSEKEDKGEGNTNQGTYTKLLIKKAKLIQILANNQVAVCHFSFSLHTTNYLQAIWNNLHIELANTNSKE